MYCVRGNYEFGIMRVMDSVRPYDRKLGPDTWFYTKRCFLALIENLAKQLMMIRDSVMRACLQFLEDCDSMPAVSIPSALPYLGTCVIMQLGQPHRLTRKSSDGFRNFEEAGEKG